MNQTNKLNAIYRDGIGTLKEFNKILDLAKETLEPDDSLEIKTIAQIAQHIEKSIKLFENILSFRNCLLEKEDEPIFDKLLVDEAHRSLILPDEQTIIYEFPHDPIRQGYVNGIIGVSLNPDIINMSFPLLTYRVCHICPPLVDGSDNRQMDHTVQLMYKFLDKVVRKTNEYLKHLKDTEGVKITMTYPFGDTRSIDITLNLSDIPKTSPRIQNGRFYLTDIYMGFQSNYETILYKETRN